LKIDELPLVPIRDNLKDMRIKLDKELEHIQDFMEIKMSEHNKKIVK
jgi:hypothetical protein